MDKQSGHNNSKLIKKKKGQEREGQNLVDNMSNKEEQNRFHYLSQTIGNKAVQNLVDTNFKGVGNSGKKSNTMTTSPYQSTFDKYASQKSSSKGEGGTSRTALLNTVETPGKDMRSRIISGKKSSSGNKIPPRESLTPIMLKSKSAPKGNVIPKKELSRPVKDKKTGLPNNIKSGIENLSGMDLSDIRVHYNSNKPHKLNAHAYTQGTEIHVAPGQEQHLAHEAWHAVQQKQGRVKATTELKGSPLNNSKALEKEADIMGAKALNAGKTGSNKEQPAGKTVTTSGKEPVQRKGFFSGVKNFFGGVGEKISDAAGAVKEGIVGAGKAVGNAIGNAADYVGEKVGDAAEFVGDKVSDAAAKISEFFGANPRKKIVEMLNKIWPEGVGYIFTGQLGATFAIPLYGGVEVKADMFHAPKDVFRLTRAVRGTVAADTGAGAGCKLQLGQFNVGVSASAEAQAGIKVSVSETFDFPVLEDNALESFMAILMQMGPGALSSSVIVKALSATLNAVTNPGKYRTKFTAELLGFGAAAANAAAGVTVGGAGANPDKAVGDAEDKAGSYWQKLLPGAFARAGITMEAGMGLEIEPPKKPDSPLKFKLYAKAGGSVAAGGGLSILKLLKARFNVVNIALEAGPYINGEVSMQNGDVNWTDWGVQFSSSPADLMSIVSGPGMTIDAGYDIEKEAESTEASQAEKEQGLSMVDLILDLIPDKLVLEKRAGVGGGFGKGFSLQNGQYLNTIFPQDKKYREWGLIVSGTYLFKFEIKKQKLMNMVKWIAQFARGNREQRDEAMRLWDDLRTLLINGTVPSWLTDKSKLEEVFRGIELKEAKVKFTIGASAAFDINAAAAFKARFHIGINAGQYREYDLKEKISIGNIVDYISSNVIPFLSNLRDKLELPMDIF